MEALMGRYLARLQRWAHGRLPASARTLLDTDDVVQDTLLNTFRRLEHFQPRHDGALLAYLREAVANRIRNELRRRGPAVDASVELDGLASALPSPLESVVSRHAIQRYEAALAQLDDNDCAAIIGRFEMGYSYDALARAMDRPFLTQRASSQSARFAGCSRSCSPMAPDEDFERGIQALLDGQALPISSGAVVGGGSLEEPLRVIDGIARAHRMALFGKDILLDCPVSMQWGHLEVRGEIGRGASGTVYRAWDTRLAREVALKLFPSDAGPDGALDEGRLLARLNHPHIVRVFGADTHDETAGVWMELLEGETLDEILARDGVFGAEETILIGIDLTRALSAVHSAGLLHRDVKARNCFASAEGAWCSWIGGRPHGREYAIGRRRDRDADVHGTRGLGRPSCDRAQRHLLPGRPPVPAPHGDVSGDGDRPRAPCAHRMRRAAACCSARFVRTWPPMSSTPSSGPAIPIPTPGTPAPRISRRRLRKRFNTLSRSGLPSRPRRRACGSAGGEPHRLERPPSGSRC